MEDKKWPQLDSELSIRGFFFDNSQKDSKNYRITKGIAEIIVAQDCDVQVKEIPHSADDRNLIDYKKGYAGRKERAIGLDKVFREYEETDTSDKEPFALAHPISGLTRRIISSAKPVESLLISKNELKQCFDEAWAKSFSSDHDSSDKYSEIWNTFSCNTIAQSKCLKQRHFDEAKAACTDLPRMGVVTVVAAFEGYVYDIIDAAFKEVFRHVDSVTSFNKAWPKDAILANSESNLLITSLGGRGEKEKGDSKKVKISLTKEFLKDFKDKLEKCQEMKEFKEKTEALPEELKENLKKETYYERFCIKVMYKCACNDDDLTKEWIEERKTCLKEHVFKKELSNPLLSTIARVVRILQTNGADCDEQAFEKIVSNVLNYGNAFNKVIASLKVHRNNCDKLKSYSYRVRRQEIEKYLVSDSSNWILKLSFGSETYRYSFTADDKKQIVQRYILNSSWNLKINSTTHYIVNINDSATLGHIMRLFYGIRCIFAHGNPDATIKHGALSKMPELDDLKLTVKMKLEYNTSETTLGGANSDPIDSECCTVTMFYLTDENKCDAEQASLDIKRYILGLWTKCEAIASTGSNVDEPLEPQVQHSDQNQATDVAITSSDIPNRVSKSNKMDIDFNLYNNIRSFYLYAAKVIGRAIAASIWNMADKSMESQFDLSVTDLEKICDGASRTTETEADCDTDHDFCQAQSNCRYGTYCFHEHTPTEDDGFRSKKKKAIYSTNVLLRSEYMNDPTRTFRTYH